MNMETIFELTALPAQYGDCLWLEYGSAESPSRILVDCGTPATWQVIKDKIEALPAGSRKFELLVITHIDVDHIGGALHLLRARKTLGIEFGEIWFNGRKHLNDDILGPKEGDMLTKELESPDLAPIWNRSAGGGSIYISFDQELPEFIFAGLKLTLMSPCAKELRQLATVWPETVRDAGLGDQNDGGANVDDTPEDTLGDLTIPELSKTYSAPDRSPANGSSIAFLAEFDSRSILLAADAFSSVLVRALTRLKESRDASTFNIDLCKLPHHGSKSNVTEKLISALNCRHYLFSTSGERFNHPDKICVARIVNRRAGSVLYFNYKSDYSSYWDSAELLAEYSYGVRFLEESNYKVSLYDIVPRLECELESTSS